MMKSERCSAHHTEQCSACANREEGSDVTEADGAATPLSARKRADARRNEQALLDAAAAVFVTRGVDAPVRDIAAQAGVGMGTIYRHFPTRADLVIAVYRHQVKALAGAAPQLLASAETPIAALAQWMDRFVDFLVTKHGLAGALRSDDSGFAALHAYFLDRLVPACASLLRAAGRGRQHPARHRRPHPHARSRQSLHRSRGRSRHRLRRPPHGRPAHLRNAVALGLRRRAPSTPGLECPLADRLPGRPRPHDRAGCRTTPPVMPRDA